MRIVCLRWQSKEEARLDKCLYRLCSQGRGSAANVFVTTEDTSDAGQQDLDETLWEVALVVPEKLLLACLSHSFLLYGISQHFLRCARKHEQRCCKKGAASSL